RELISWPLSATALRVFSHLEQSETLQPLDPIPNRVDAQAALFRDASQAGPGNAVVVCMPGELDGNCQGSRSYLGAAVGEGVRQPEVSFQVAPTVTFPRPASRLLHPTSAVRNRVA